MDRVAAAGWLLAGAEYDHQVEVAVLVSSPRAQLPKRMTCSGWKRSTMSWVMAWMVSRLSGSSTTRMGFYTAIRASVSPAARAFM